MKPADLVTAWNNLNKGARTLITLLLVLLVAILAVTIPLTSYARRQADAWHILCDQERMALETSYKVRDAERAKDDAQIANLTASVAHQLTQAASAKAAAAGRQAKINALDGALAKAKTDAERVPILVSEVTELKAANLSLGQEADALDLAVFLVTGKYDLQVKETGSWKGQWADEHKLRLDDETQIKWKDREIIGLRIELHISVGVNVGLFITSLFFILGGHL